MRRAFSYVFLIVSIIVLSYFVKENWGAIVRIYNRLTYVDVIIQTLLLLVIFIISGIRISIINRAIVGIRISLYHQVILPLAMSYAGYAIPVKGGMVYQSFFLKKFYSINHFHGVSSGIIAQIVPLQLVGTLGAIMTFNIGSSSELYYSFVAIAFLSLFFFFLVRLFSSLGFVRITKFGFLLEELNSKIHLNALFIELYVISFVKIIFEFLWFYLALLALDFNSTVELAIVFVTVRNCLIILKVTPGNIGINEFVGGLSSELLFSSFEYGLSVMLLIRVLSLLITFTLGSFFFYKHKIY